MITLGIILLIVGLLVHGLHILFTIGIILLAVGLVLALLGATGRTIAGRRHYSQNRDGGQAHRPNPTTAAPGDPEAAVRVPPSQPDHAEVSGDVVG